MVPPGNYTVIPSAQVAVRNWGMSSIETASRRLLESKERGYTRRESGSLVWFANMTDRFHERMKLLEALEVRIIPEDDEVGQVVEFDWDIKGYDNNFVWL